MSFPKTIYFCNKTLDKMHKFANSWKILNPDYDIQLYDDTMCENFLLDEYGELYKDIFKYIRDGPIKADFWRVCILYKYGGFYSDIDNKPLVAINTFLEPNIDFMTCSSCWIYNFNPNFIGSNKNNIILKNCIDWYLNKYNDRHKTYDYWGWSIMAALSDTLYLRNYLKTDGIYEVDDTCVNLLTIGASSTNIKELQINTNYINKDYIITKYNWIGGDTYNDTFNIMVRDGVCIIQRTDLNTGWDMNLRVKLDMECKNEPMVSNMKVQIIEEFCESDRYNDHNIYKNIKIFNNRHAEWDYISHSFI
jgi:hypothetical protein